MWSHERGLCARQLLGVVGILFVMLVPQDALSATPRGELIEELTKRRAVLEQELERINSRIKELESKTAATSQSGELLAYYIKDFGIDTIDAVGGVEPYIVFVNQRSESPIKYAKVRITPYNAVGDVIASTIGGETAQVLKITGPIEKEEGERRFDWGPVWYNHSATCVRISSVHIEFVNGKTLSFVDKTLKKALAPELSNECKLRKK